MATRVRLLIGSLLILCLLCMTSCGGSGSPGTSQPGSNTAGQAKVIELKLNSQMPATGVMAETLKYFADTIAARTNGRVKITYFPAGTLSPVEKIAEAISTGVCDLGFVAPAYSPGRFPAMDACYLPLRMKSTWVYSHAVHDFYTHFKPKEFSDMRVLFVSGSGPYHLATVKKLVSKPEDIKGLKVRTAGAQTSEFIQALGGTPVAMPMSDAYEAADKGVVDALLIPLEPLQAWKHGEVTKYVTKLPLTCASPPFVAMNLRAWNSLPEDIQKVFDEVANEMVEVFARAWWYGDLKGEEFFLSLGGGRQVVEIPSDRVAVWEERLLPLREKYVSEKSAAGLPAEEYVKYLDERVEYWNARQPDPQEVIEWIEKEILKKR